MKKSPFISEENGNAQQAHAASFPHFAAEMLAVNPAGIPEQDLLGGIGSSLLTITPPDLESSSDSGDSNSDNLSNVKNPVFSGYTDPQATVILYTKQGTSPLRNIGTAVADDNGRWQITAATLNDGVQDIYARALDINGNVVTSTALTVTIKSSIGPVSTPDLAAASDSGSSNSDNITNASTLVFNGTAEAGAKLEIWDGNTKAGTTTALPDGSWSLSLSSLGQGIHQLNAIARDVAGNSSISGVLALTVDRTAPGISLDLDDAADSGRSKTDNITANKALNLSGTSEPDALVKISDGSTVLGSVVAGKDGIWHFTSPALIDAVHNLSASATDPAGNISAVAKLDVKIDSHVPPSSVPDLISSSDSGTSSTDNLTKVTTPTFSGKTEADADVVLYDGATIVGQTISNANGDWSITSTTLKDGKHDFSTIVTSLAGVSSPKSATLTVQIDTAITVSVPDLSSASDTGDSNTDDITKLTTPTISGKAEPNAFVNIYENGVVLGQTSANANGDWSVISKALAHGDHLITARASDRAGNVAPFTAPLKINVDLQAPNAPTLNLAAGADSGASNNDRITNADPVLFTGNAEANATVSIYENNLKLGSAKADASGNWSLNLSKFSEGSHNLVAKAVDVAGNESPASSSLSVQFDYTAPTANSPDLQAVSDSGRSNSDDITSQTELQFAGQAEPGAEITLYDGANQVGSGKADAGGQWQIKSSALADGVHAISISATDIAGNTSGKSNPLSVTVDRTAPTPPTLGLAAGSDSGANNNDGLTNVYMPVLTGRSEANAQIVVSDGASVLGIAVADGKGDWSLSAPPLSDGPHLLQASAVDAAGNSSLPTSFTLVIDTAPPSPSIPDLEAASDSGVSDNDDVTSVNTPVFSGSSEAGAKIELFDNQSVSLGSAIVGADGKWRITSSTLTDGIHQISTRSTDLAGNISAFSQNLKVTIDSKLPTISTPDLLAGSDSGASDSDNITRINTPTFSGTTEAGAVVKLLEGNLVLGQTTADANGLWQVSSSSLADGKHLISAQAQDKAGNPAANSGILEIKIDTTAPLTQTPDLQAKSDSGVSDTDNITKESRPWFAGVAEAGASVMLAVDGKATVSTLAAANGNWEVQSTALGDGKHQFQVQVTDLAGNTSAWSNGLEALIDTQAPSGSVPDLDASSDSNVSDDNITNQNQLQFNGQAEAYSSVQLYAGTALLAGTTADANGKWSVLNLSLAEGTHQINTKVSDAAGNSSANSANLMVTVDRSLPPLAAPDMEADSDKGDSQTDNITNQTRPVFSGSAEAGASIRLLDNNNLQLGFATADANGQWRITSNTLTDGDYRLHLVQRDVAGNQNISGETTIRIDTSRPGISTPDLLAIDDSSYGQAGGDSDNLTNVTSPRFSGAAEPGSKVFLTDGGRIVGQGVADASGAWQIQSQALLPGAHTIQAYAQDLAGNQSALSAPLTLQIDTSAILPAAPDLQAGSDSGDFDTDNLTNVTTPRIGGSQVEANAKVLLYELALDGGLTSLGETIANAQGDWQLNSRALGEGTHQIVARIIDAAGNLSSNSPQLQVTIDTTPPQNSPTQPVLVSDSNSDSGTLGDNLTKNNRPEFSGKAEAGLKLELYDGGQKIGDTRVAADGSWRVSNTQLLSDGYHQITALVRDAAGNASPVSLAQKVQIDTQAPRAPSYALADETDTGFKGDFITKNTHPRIVGEAGSSEAGAQILLRSGSDTGPILGQTKAAADGSWSITFDTPNDALIFLYPQAVDAAGNIATAIGKPLLIDNTPPPPSSTPDLMVKSDSGFDVNDNLTNITSPYFSGTGPIGELVGIFENEVLLGWSEIDSNGNWQVQTLNLSEGSHQLYTKSGDRAGNFSDKLGLLNVRVDITAPTAASAPDLADSDDSGISASDNITKVAQPTLSGTGQAGEYVGIYENNVLLDYATVGSNGSWQIKLSQALPDGLHFLYTKSADQAGNYSPESARLALTIDTKAPNMPSTPDMTTGSDWGDSSSDNLTANNLPTFNGVADAGELVGIIEGDQLLAYTTANQLGLWSLTPDRALSDGTHMIAARAADVAGNLSAVSAYLPVTINTVPPGIPGQLDLPAGSDSGFDPTDNLTSNSTPQITGQADPGRLVRLYDGNTVVGSGYANSSGQWAITSSKLADGVHSLSASSMSAAGAWSAKSAALGITIDTAPPSSASAPDLSDSSDAGISQSDNITNINTPTFSGSGMAGAYVGIYENEVLLSYTTISGNGSWQITLSNALSDGVHQLYTKSADQAGNYSAASAKLQVIIDTVAPSVPVVPDMTAGTDSGASPTDNITNRAQPQFVGSGNTGDYVGIGEGADLLSYQLVSGSAWALTPNVALRDGSHAIYAIAADIAGNRSAPSSALNVTIDTLAPTATFSAPSASTSANFWIGINTEAGVLGRLYIDNAYINQATLQASQTINLPGLGQGSHTLYVTVEDTAGNLGRSNTVTTNINGLRAEVVQSDPFVLANPNADTGDVQLVGVTHFI